MTTDALPTLPPNASYFTRLRLALQALEVLKDDPANAHYGPLVNACMDSETYAKLAQTWRGTDHGRALLDARPTLQGRELDLDALARLPPGTLGHEFVRYFRDNGITPFVTAFPIRNDVDYLSKRYRETHDLVHVITGYGTDEPGEVELQAFVLGNLALRQALLIVAVGAARQIKREGFRDFGGFVRRLQAAYRRGRRSRELLSVSWEGLWDRPVAEVAELVCAPA